MPMQTRRKPNIRVMASMPDGPSTRASNPDSGHRNSEEVDDRRSEQKENHQDREGINARHERFAIALCRVHPGRQRQEQGRGAERVHDGEQCADRQRDRVAKNSPLHHGAHCCCRNAPSQLRETPNAAA